MKIVSPAFEHNQIIPEKYTCDGENKNPPLIFSEIPTDAKSLVLIVEDPDAPGRTFTHWLLYNIDPSITEIAEGMVPEGTLQGLNDAGESSYYGPCPPSGVHRYFFRLFALDTQMQVGSNASKETLMNAMENHIVDKAELIGLYSREVSTL